MCTPVLAAVASTGLGIAQSVMQYSSQKAAYNDNKINANTAFISEQDALQRQQLSEQDAAANDKMMMNREAVAKIAEVQNIASASGTTGLSVDGLIGSIRRQEVDRQDAANTNLDSRISEIESEKKASGQNYVARVKSVQKPSGLSLGIGIGNAILGGVGSYYQMKKP